MTATGQKDGVGTDDLNHAIELVKIGGGRSGYRTHGGCGGIWCGYNKNGFPDANFIDWGLARATAIILNALINGELVPAAMARAKERAK